MSDPIVEEIRRIRSEIAAEHGNDLPRIFEAARRQQGAEGRRVLSLDAADREQPTTHLHLIGWRKMSRKPRFLQFRR